MTEQHNRDETVICFDTETAVHAALRGWCGCARCVRECCAGLGQRTGEVELLRVIGGWAGALALLVCRCSICVARLLQVLGVWLSCKARGALPAATLPVLLRECVAEQLPDPLHDGVVACVRRH